MEEHCVECGHRPDECVCDKEKETFVCERCGWDFDMRYDYAGCCNDGDCKFGRERLCNKCVIYNEETGVPVCLDCIKKPRRIIKARVPKES